MVKVLPTTFTLFENEDIIVPKQEPLCIHCSDEYVFAACEEQQIVVYSLSTRDIVANLSTIWPVSELAYSRKGDCIVTIERRPRDHLATSRIYLSWRNVADERPTRVGGVAFGSPSMAPNPPSRPNDVEIVELPVDNVSCISVCDLTGVIAVGSQRMVRVFVLKVARSDRAGTASAPDEVKVTAFVDIKMDMKLKKINICGNYIACISRHCVRVIKLHILGSSSHPWMEFYQPGEEEGDLGNMGKGQSKNNGCPEDDHFVMWSPSLVWEEESVRITSPRRQARTVAMATISAMATAGAMPAENSQGTDGISTGDDGEGGVSDPALMRSQAHEWIHEGKVAQMDDPKPTVRAISLPMVVQAINQSKNKLDKHELEVLGPVEYVWGQSLSTQLHREAGQNVKCRVLTMLFRRFPSLGYVYAPTEVCSKSLNMATMEAVRKKPTSSLSKENWSKGGTLPSKKLKPKKKSGLHSVQLSPTLCEGEGGSQQLVGLACIVANKTHCYLYDVYQRTKRVSTLNFMQMNKCLSVVYDGSFLHALSSDAVDSYTTRIGASAMAKKPFVRGTIPGTDDKRVWLGQPCPPSSMEVTLISSNILMGACDIATSLSHVTVLCKNSDGSFGDSGSPRLEPSAGRHSLLHSLSLRRSPKSSSTKSWNIYVLEKKGTLAMFQQFIESAESFGEYSPPNMQHHLSEAHLLLRAKVIDTGPTSNLASHLRCNCFKLADSICQYSADMTPPGSGAGYFLLSGKPISSIVQHVIENYPEGKELPYKVLMLYLKMVLFDEENAYSQMDTLQPLSDQILELYARYDVERLPDFVLHSWLTTFSKDEALQFMQQLFPKVQANEPLACSYRVGMAFLLTELGRLEEAQKMLSTLSGKFLLDWAKKNPTFLLDVSNKSLTAMGKLVMEHFEKSFASFVLHQLKLGLLPWETFTSALQVGNESVLVNCLVLKSILEDIVSGTVSMDPQITVQATMLLVTVLFARVRSDSSSKSSFVKFGQRHAWINRLPPFEGTLESSADNVLYSTNLKDYCELQSLLCSSHMTKDLARHVDHLLTTHHAHSNPNLISFQLLTLPQLDKLSQATMLLLETFPDVVVDYCQTYFKSRFSLWKVLLQEILSRISCSEDEPSPSICSVYKDVLLHVVTITSPEELFTLLPSDGNLAFFLGVIERSCKFDLASRVTSSLQVSMNSH